MKEISNASIGLSAIMRTRGVGRKAALKLIKEDINDLNVEDAIEIIIECLKRAKLDAVDFRSHWDLSSETLLHNLDHGIRCVSFFDSDYPTQLAHTPDPPAIIYVKGPIENLIGSKIIAIVGTREPTKHGCEVALKLGKVSAQKGFVVVSGLAHGCDTYGHRGCLNGQGIGVAVLAHGLDRVYPAANRGLAEELLNGGGSLLSEYPMNVTPIRAAFAERDRIQSGLAQGVLVIETDVKGGTMHTVRFARDQNRHIACLQHKPEMLTEEKTRGNQKLISEKVADPIANGLDFENFLSKISRAQFGINYSDQSGMDF